MLEVDADEKGATIWKKALGGKTWVIDGSTLLEDGEITIVMSEFNIETDVSEKYMVLKYKDA